MSTDSQPKKSLSAKKPCKKNEEIVSKLMSKTWWPFDRVDGKLLEKLHKQTKQQPEYEEALL